MNNSQQAISKSCKQDTWLIGLSLSILETFPLFSSSMIHSYDFLLTFQTSMGVWLKKNSSLVPKCYATRCIPSISQDKFDDHELARAQFSPQCKLQQSRTM